MSAFDDLLSAGFDVMLDFTSAEIAFKGVKAKCIPASAPNERQLRDSGLWETGMVTVELKREDFDRLQIIALAAVEYNGRKMRVDTINDDPSDPCVRLTIKPANSGGQ